MGDIIDFDSIRNIKATEGVSKITGREIGNITISVLIEPKTKLPFYYIKPDKKELIPIVDLLDETLTKSRFKTK